MDDKDIVEQFLRRSEDAIRYAEERYGAYCAYIAGHIAGTGEADACVNEALHAAWKSIPPQHPENLKAYLGKLTREIAISHRRYDRAAKRDAGAFAGSLEELEEVASDDSIEEAVDAALLSAAISDFLRTLPDTERTVMIRRYWYGDSLREIAARFGFGESRIKSMLKRSRDKLARYLRKEGYME